MSRRDVRQPDPYLVEVPAYVPGVGLTTLRFSTHSLTADPADGALFYDGRVSDIGSFNRSIWGRGATSGKATVDAGYSDLIALDGSLDALIGYGFGRIATIKNLAARNAPLSGATTVMRPIVDGIETSDAVRKLRLRYRGRMAELDQPLLTRRYLGTTTSADAAVQTEGDATLAGQIVPYAFGVNTSAPGKPISRFKQLFQFAGNAQASIVPMDGAVEISTIGDFGSASALLNATIPAGRSATCFAEGMARFGSPPIYAVTANLVEGASSATRSAARIMQRLLALVASIAGADIETATFDAFHAFNAAEVCSYIDDDKSGIDVISAVADSVGGALIETPLGTYQVVYNGGPSATSSDATFTTRELLDGAAMQLFAGPANEGAGTPAYRVVVNYGRIWKTLTAGELVPRVAEATSGADLALKTLLGQRNQVAIAEDASVKTTYPLAVELTFDTLIANAADAAAEAARRLALYKVRRDRVSFPTFMHRGEIELGRTVTIQMNRFGWSAGKRFLVIGREDDWKRQRRILSLWG